MHFSVKFIELNFGSLIADVFFQLILIFIIYNCNIRVKKSMDFFVWVGKTRGTLCVGCITSFKSSERITSQLTILKIGCWL